MKRCSKCIIPEAALGIHLNGDGLCQLCADFQPVISKGEQALVDLIAPHRATQTAYDCVVPVSGGRDSAYALFYAKNILHLNPIAVHNDNDFESETASRNLDSMTNILGVPLVRLGSTKKLSRKVVVEKYKMNAPFGPGLVVEQTCEACKYGFTSASYNIARQSNAKVIIWGDSNEESTQSYHSLIHHRYPGTLEKIFSPGLLNRFKYKYYYAKLRRELGPCDPSGLVQVHFFDFIEWDRTKITQTIHDELGWERPSGSATSWRIDCTLVPLVNHLTSKAYGVSKMELGFSNFIRNGKMDRSEALDQIQAIESATSREDMIAFLHDLGVSDRGMEAVL